MSKLVFSDDRFKFEGDEIRWLLLDGTVMVSVIDLLEMIRPSSDNVARLSSCLTKMYTHSKAVENIVGRHGNPVHTGVVSLDVAISMMARSQHWNKAEMLNALIDYFGIKATKAPGNQKVFFGKERMGWEG